MSYPQLPLIRMSVSDDVLRAAKEIHNEYEQRKYSRKGGDYTRRAWDELTASSRSQFVSVASLIQSCLAEYPTSDSAAIDRIARALWGVDPDSNRILWVANRLREYRRGIERV